MGGSQRALDAARPVLSVLGRDLVHLGANGSGSLMKLINNFLAAVQTASFGEALALIRAGGLNPEKAIGILTEGVPGSPMVKRAAARAASGDFTPHFLLRLMAKDISYALEEAGQRQVTLQTATTTLAMFKQAIVDGYGEKDFTAIIESLSSRWVTS